jgi:hypothetical protein
MEKPFSIQELNEILPRLRATVEAAARLAEVQRAVGEIARPAVRRGRPPKAASPAGAVTTSAARRGRKNDPASASTLRGRIVGYLGSAKKGAALRDIAGALDADAEAVRYGLNLLRGEKKVRMSGSRATALWHTGG